jgi:hypothetical protein
MNDKASASAEPKRRWFEPVSAILMAVASLSTAWCSYQSSLWGGLSSDLATKADKLERKAVAQHLEAQQLQSIQMRAVMEVIDAKLSGNETLMRFYTDRFGAELKPAYEKWLELKPFENPAAPPHPLVPSLYTSRFDEPIRNDRAQAEQAAKESNLQGAHASSYLSNTVILATVLFFAGTAGKFDQRRVRLFSLCFAIALFSYAAARMFMLPVA